MSGISEIREQMHLEMVNAGVFSTLRGEERARVRDEIRAKYAPKISASERRAAGYRKHIHNVCDHDLVVVSHEESKCRKCGQYFSIPDMD